MTAFQVGNFNPQKQKQAAIEAAKARASAAKPEDAALVKYTSPAECAERNRIVFDDSGSMCWAFENAKRGVVEYLRNCIPNQTAVAVHFMNTSSWSTGLRSDLPQLAEDVKEAQLKSGGTPFFNTLKRALEAAPRATRIIAFTDGAPTDSLEAESDEPGAMQSSNWSQAPWKSSADVIVKIAKSTTTVVPIDTVYFGEQSEWTRSNIELLKYLSEATGGFFMVFDPAKVDFASAFKYLAPVNRLRLTDGSFRAALERGEVK